MKKIIFTFFIFLLTTSPVYGGWFDLEFVGTYQGKDYPCVELKWLKKGVTCYAKINGKVKSIGIDIKQWTGLYDKTFKKIYEWDAVRTSGIPDGIVIFENNEFRYGYYIWGNDGEFYSFKNLDGQLVGTWSEII